jgi:hypothetical protein
MKPQANDSDKRTIFQDYELVKWFMQWPALSVMVLLRQDLGYRMVDPICVVATTGGLAVLTVMATPYNDGVLPFPLLVFTALSFTFGIAQRIRRWKALNRGIQQHSEYIGTSPVNFRWLPFFVRRNRRVERLIDPLICVVVGFAFYPVSHALCVWLVFSGACLRAYEHNIHVKERAIDLDLIDGLVTSQRHARVVEEFESSPNVGPQPTASVPSGMSADIQTHIKNRQS